MSVSLLPILPTTKRGRELCGATEQPPSKSHRSLQCVSPRGAPRAASAACLPLSASDYIRWELRAHSGVYAALPATASAELEHAFLAGQPEVTLQLGDGGLHTVCLGALRPGAAAAERPSRDGAPVLRRWLREVSPPLTWDHQTADVAVVEVCAGSHDWQAVSDCVFGRRRPAGPPSGRRPAGARSEPPAEDENDPLSASLSTATHRIVRVERVQNLSLLRRYNAERANMSLAAGTDGVHER